MKKIYALVGMCGSGKSTAADVFLEAGWAYIRFGQVTIDKLKENGEEINPENEKRMRETLRQKYGMGVFARLSILSIEAAVQNKNVIIDGLYSWSEYTILKDRFSDSFKVIAIYSSPATRYRRLESREHDESDTYHRMRKLTAAEAKNRDYSEIENIEKGGPIAMADYTIVNEGSNEELKKQISHLL